MDSGSHLLFGLTLAGLATIDPMVFNNPEIQKAVAIGTIVGSMCPDFDVLTRFNSYASYIRHHRGVTHSVPALIIWPTLIAILITNFLPLPYTSFPLIWEWTLIGVLFHVFLDMLNSYGVQCFRPLTKRWVHLDILCIFEPILFLIHLGGIVSCLIYPLSPDIVFSWVYLITFLYIAVRTWQHFHLKKIIPYTLRKEGICQVIPSFHWFHWRFILETDTAYYTGKVEYRKIEVKDIYYKESYLSDDMRPIFEATLGLDGVRAFLHFAQRIHVNCKAFHDGYKVSFSDVRFWYDQKLLPFGVDVHLDKELNVIDHTLGWRKKAWDPPYV